MAQQVIYKWRWLLFPFFDGCGYNFTLHWSIVSRYANDNNFILINILLILSAKISYRRGSNSSHYHMKLFFRQFSQEKLGEDGPLTKKSDGRNIKFLKDR